MNKLLNYLPGMFLWLLVRHKISPVAQKSGFSKKRSGVKSLRSIYLVLYWYFYVSIPWKWGINRWKFVTRVLEITYIFGQIVKLSVAPKNTSFNHIWTCPESYWFVFIFFKLKGEGRDFIRTMNNNYKLSKNKYFRYALF